MEAGAIAPRAYILSRTAGPGLVQTALAAFSITPLSCVIISDMKDHPLAREFGVLIVRTRDEEQSVDFAIESFDNTKMPCLVIGSRSGITAINEDESVETLPWQDLNFPIN